MNKEQRLLAEERIKKVLKEDPSVTVRTLAQRFGVSESTVRRIQKVMGLSIANNRTEFPSRKEIRKSKAPKGHYRGGRI